jgi:hypothetical protein
MEHFSLDFFSFSIGLRWTIPPNVMMVFSIWLFWKRVNRYFLQSFNKFGNLRQRKNRLCHKENLKWKILKKMFLNFKLIFLNFEKENFGKNIIFEIWKKNWPCHQSEMKRLKYATKIEMKFEMEFFENFHFWNLKWKCRFEIWEKCPYHQREMK